MACVARIWRSDPLGRPHSGFDRMLSSGVTIQTCTPPIAAGRRRSNSTTENLRSLRMIRSTFQPEIESITLN